MFFPDDRDLGDDGREYATGQALAAEAMFALADGIVRSDPEMDDFNALMHVCSAIPVHAEDGGPELPFVGFVLEGLCRLASDAIGAEAVELLRAGIREALWDLDVRPREERA